MVERDELKARYQEVMDRVAAAAKRSGRTASEILTVAVTKYASPEEVRHLISIGHRDLGESRAQQLVQRAAMSHEFLGRHHQLGTVENDDPIRWHFIGQLQRNKVKSVLPVARLIHSVGSLRLLEEIQTQAVRMEQDVDMLLQVNIAKETTKSGLSLPAVAYIADQVRTMAHVQLRGLMMMAPKADDPEQSRSWFSQLADQFHEMRRSGRFGKSFNILSMGMSDDFEVAIECGANVVRIGRGIFGERTAD